MNCSADLYHDRIEVSISGFEYTLPIERVFAVDFEMDIDVERYSKSSMLKGVVGAALFGVEGAVIGSAPKTKTKRLVTCSAIINYTAEDGQQQFLLLTDATPNSLQAAKFTGELQKLVPDTPKMKKTL